MKLLLQITLQSGLVRETLRHERYHKSIVFPANHLANVLTNKKTERYRKIHSTTRLNKPQHLKIIYTIDTS